MILFVYEVLVHTLEAITASNQHFDFVYCLKLVSVSTLVPMALRILYLISILSV